jgi:hypothetical protein
MAGRLGAEMNRRPVSRATAWIATFKDHATSCGDFPPAEREIAKDDFIGPGESMQPDDRLHLRFLDRP